MPDADDRGHLFGSSDHADSAGFPWEGRRFHENAASGDDGSADPALLAALNAFAALNAHPSAPDPAEPSGGAAAVQGPADQDAVIDAFRRARLLVPLLAHAGELGETPEGHLVDKTQELSIATVQAPDGRAVLPAFTSVQALSAWNPQARPVPAVGPRIALAAASEGTELVVIDATSPTEFVLRRPAVTAVATGADWHAPWADADVLAEFRASIADEPSAVGVTLSPGDPAARLAGPELVVGLGLVPGLGTDAVDGIVRRMTGRWAASALIAERVDSMTLRLRSAGPAEP